jgi:hypothetical protein
MANYLIQLICQKKVSIQSPSLGRAEGKRILCTILPYCLERCTNNQAGISDFLNFGIKMQRNSVYQSPEEK